MTVFDRVGVGFVVASSDVGVDGTAVPVELDGVLSSVVVCSPGVGDDGGDGDGDGVSYP